LLAPYVLHGPKSNDLCDKGRLIKETFIAISQFHYQPTLLLVAPYKMDTKFRILN
jgi:hypothetical protein